MTKRASLDGSYGSVGRFRLAADDPCVVVLSTEAAGGFVHADAVLLVPTGQ
jgi:hypothetical protein